MKITIEFDSADKFFRELPQFARVIGFSGNFVDYQRKDKTPGEVEMTANVPELVEKDGKMTTAHPEDADRIIEAAKNVGAYVEKAPEKPQDAPKETADKVSTETAKAPENAKSEASADKEKMPKPVEADAVDIATCRKVLHAKIKAGFRDQMKELLAKLGAENVSTLAPEKYSEFVSEADKIGGDGNA